MSPAPFSTELPRPNRWHPCGVSSWLGHWDDEETFARLLPGLVAALESQPPTGLAEFVPGFQTLLLIFSRPTPRDFLENWWASLEPTSTPRKEGTLWTLPVRYDGPDLARLAGDKNLSIEEVIHLHSTPVYTVRLLGFSPGFPYLGPLDPRLHTPRLTTPRPRIEPGSVAIGGPHTGIYSVASPGGWHIVGRTDVPLFRPEAARETSPDASRIFLLKPGDRVRFEVVS